MLKVENFASMKSVKWNIIRGLNWFPVKTKVPLCLGWVTSEKWPPTQQMGLFIGSCRSFNQLLDKNQIVIEILLLRIENIEWLELDDGR